MKESPFSGIYRVIRCENVFNGGVFTQKLECLRMIGQSVEFADNPAALQAQQVTPENSALTVEGENTPERTSVLEDSESPSAVSPNVTVTNLSTGQVTSTTTTTTGGGVTVRTADPQVTGRATQRSES
jgi:hypothetical protein